MGRRIQFNCFEYRHTVYFMCVIAVIMCSLTSMVFILSNGTAFWMLKTAPNEEIKRIILHVVSYLLRGVVPRQRRVTHPTRTAISPDRRLSRNTEQILQHGSATYYPF